MIQTQLLKADKPYQIISAAGMVGIQVATLIVAEESTDEDGNFFVDTHSHPVVNYGNKEGLDEDLKYYNGNPDEEYKYTCRMQPEGAVWNRVEVRNVRVLGLVGAKNIWVDLETFVDLVPSVYPHDRLSHLWDVTTPSRMRNLFFSLDRVGINIAKTVTQTYTDRDFNQIIHLELEEDRGQHQVLVKIRGNEEDFSPIYLSPIYFRSILEDNPVGCINTIGRCMAALYHHFTFNPNLRFVYYRKQEDQNNKWADHLERVTEHINNNFKTYLSNEY